MHIYNTPAPKAFRNPRLGLVPAVGAASSQLSSSLAAAAASASASASASRRDKACLSRPQILVAGGVTDHRATIHGIFSQHSIHTE